MEENKSTATYAVLCFSFESIITDASIKVVPIIRVAVSFSLNNKIPIIILTIGSKVPSIDVEDAPIIFSALTNNPIEIIVEIKEMPTIEVVVWRFVGKYILPLSNVKTNNDKPANAEK